MSSENPRKRIELLEQRVDAMEELVTTVFNPRMHERVADESDPMGETADQRSTSQSERIGDDAGTESEERESPPDVRELLAVSDRFEVVIENVTPDQQGVGHIEHEESDRPIVVFVSQGSLGVSEGDLVDVRVHRVKKTCAHATPITKKSG